MRWTYVVAMVIAAYLIFLVTRLPAHLVYVYAQDKIPELALSELQGTVWQGTARSAVYNGIHVGKLDWSTHPFRFLLGEWSAEIQLEGPVESLADIAYSLTDTLTMTNASGKASLSDLSRFFPQLSIMGLEGSVSARIESLTLKGETLLDIRGKVDITNLFAGGLQLGDFTAEMNTDEEGTKKLLFASVGNDGLDARGEILLTRQEQISLDLLVRNPEHLGSLGGFFRQFSSEQPDGYRFRWAGEFADLKKYM